jgi:(1->4)-alpha-D-glucan 1-alpha-D-glucosylmutase
MVNGLSQTLLKIASPGVPDFYQGSELWDLRLVDPDNRGPIDFGKRVAALHSVANLDTADSVTLRELVEHWPDGCIKLYLIRKALHFRRDHTDLFRDGEFVPLQTTGVNARNVSAFLRRHGNSWALAAVPRWLSQVTAKGNRGFDWGDTKLKLPSDSPADWKSVLTQTQLTLRNDAGAPQLMAGDLLQEFPVAFFYAEGR